MLSPSFPAIAVLSTSLTVLSAYAASADALATSRRVYVGTYSTPGNPGIHLFEFNPATGELSRGRPAGEASNPSFLALHPTGRFLYAVSEDRGGPGSTGGRVVAFALDARTGTLDRLNDQETHGDHPCHLSLDRRGRFLFVANYSSGNVAVFPVEPDGRLAQAVDRQQHAGSGPVAHRQEAPHAHGIYPDPDNRFVLVPDLGIDRVVAYRFDPVTGRLTPSPQGGAALPPGSGPRHLTFDPAGRFVYVINELSSTLTLHRWEAATGAMPHLQQIGTLPPGFTNANTTAEVATHPNGRLLYASNRGHDSLAIYRIDPADGRLSLVGHQPVGGRTPRHFAIDPLGHWLIVAHQDSGSLQVFRVDPETGKLAAVHGHVQAPKPVCILFDTAP